MSGGATTSTEVIIPEFKQVMGHPAPLWMLFMSEFWERFAFYGIRWALTLYIVAQFHNGDPAGQKDANLVYGSYLAVVYAAALLGGYVADRVLGYQRSILIGAAFMAAGLFMISYPEPNIFKLGLATIITGNGLFKPNISTMVGKLYAQGDERRDSGFTIFYMGINAGAFLAPILTEYLARKVFNIGDTPAYKVVFISAGIGMLISLVWFNFGRKVLKGIGEPLPGHESPMRMAYVILGCFVTAPVIYFLLQLGSANLQIILTIMFVVLAVLLLIEGIKNGPVARDKVIALLIIFTVNVLFWMFFEQAGSSFTFLADNIVQRQGAMEWLTSMFNRPEFPTAWFQSVNSVAIIVMAPIIAWIWIKMGSKNPSIPRKFSLGIIFNGLAFGILMYALGELVGADGKIPFWPLFAVYWVQSIGELCLSPIGLSMVTKLAPTRLVGLGMGGWFLSTGIGNNLSGQFAAFISGESGMTTASALHGYTLSLYVLVGAGALLFLLAPLIQKLMHGVK